MNSKLIGAIAFAVGAAVGSIVTWKFVETKYKKIADEEIKSVKEVFAKQEEYRNIACKYSTVEEDAPEKDDKEDGEGDEKDMSKPYVISPDEFGDKDYELVSLNYFADKVLTDSWDNVIENVDYMVGKESLETFGQYEDDAVYVRNDNHKVDYEILLDLRNYSDIKDKDQDE